MKCLIQVATQFEAAYLIRELNLERNRLPGLSHFYQNKEHSIALWISGIGKDKLLRTLQRVINLTNPNPTETTAVNLGIAGLTSCPPSKDRPPTGTAFAIQSVSLKSDHNQQPDTFEFSPHSQAIPPLPQANLFTVSSPVQSPQKRSDSNETCPQLVDMEAYYWATSLCRSYHFPSKNLLSIKIISDYADGEIINFRKLGPVYDSAIKQICICDTYFPLTKA